MWKIHCSLYIYMYVDTEEVQKRIIVMKVMIPISDKDNCILGWFFDCISYTPATFVIFTIREPWCESIKKVSLSVVWLLHIWHSVWGDVECLSACWHFLHSPPWFSSHHSFDIWTFPKSPSPVSVYFYPVMMVAMVITMHRHDNQSGPDHWPWHHTHQ